MSTHFVCINDRLSVCVSFSFFLSGNKSHTELSFKYFLDLLCPRLYCGPKEGSPLSFLAQCDCRKNTLPIFLIASVREKRSKGYFCRYDICEIFVENALSIL